MLNTKSFAPGLLSSGQPSPADLAEIAARGVRTVINLRSLDESTGYDEPAEAQRLGLHYISIPVAGPQDITPETVARFSRELEAASRLGGTLVHCASGNRVGALVALDQGLVKRVPSEQAIAMGRAAGLEGLEPLVLEMLRKKSHVHAFPHLYQVSASGTADGRVVLSHDGLVPIESSSPAEFGGPGDAWSPESLLVAAVADCFILTFRAVARASKLEWSGLKVRAEGKLERREGVTAFTDFTVHATLCIDSDIDEALARSALERAERGCLVTNSLKAPVHLEIELVMAVVK